MPSLPKEDKKPWIREVKRTDNSEIKESQDFYNSRTWRKVRGNYIKNNPLCADCFKKDKYVAATVVDHVIPIRQEGAKYDTDNFQSLCAKCHNKKRSLESAGIIQPWKLNQSNKRVPA